MGVLDADRTRAALGDRLAARFLQYAVTTAGADAERFLVRVDEHLAEMLHAADRRGDPATLAQQIATTCKRLLLRWGDSEPEARAAIVGAVRYFLETHDLSRDDEALGLDDDAQVVDYVVAAVAPELSRPAETR